MRSAAVVLSLVGLACSGEIVAPVQLPAKVEVCVPSGKVAPSPMLRLTRAQLDNVIKALVATSTVVPSTVLSTDEKNGPFSVNAVTSVSRDLAEQYQFIAEKIGDDIEANVQTVVPCAGSTDAKVAEACAVKLIADFGPRAFRRPLSSDDAARWLTLYRLEATAAGYAGGVRAVVEGMLQSPNLLYRIERVPDGADPALTELYNVDAYALASRLSFLVWNSGPDASLLAAAQAGDLATREQLATAAERLLADPRGRQSSVAFTEGWAGIETLLASASSPARMQDVDPALVPLMRAETIDLVDDVLRIENGSLKQLLTTTRSRMPASLAQKIYGVPTTQAADATGFFELPQGQRSGVLSQASVMFSHAHSEQTSPVLRGKWLRQNLLCQHIADPPAGVVAVPGMPQPGQTTRERAMVHRSDPTCAACHQLLDDTGFGFESFDQFGRHRTTDANKPVDDTGVLVGTDVDGPFRGVIELGEKLAKSDNAAACFAQQWFQFGMGHAAGTQETCTLESMATSAKNGNHRELVRALVTSDAFAQRRAP